MDKFTDPAKSSKVDAGPPDPKQELISELAKMHRLVVNRRYRPGTSDPYTWPIKMPEDLEAAATWWMRFLEPQRQDERPRQAAVAGSGTGNRWECPYNIRIRSCLFNYFALTAADRAFLHAGREDGVFWRGENMKMYSRVIDETLRMREIGIEAYRTEAIKKMRRCLAGMDMNAKRSH